MLAETAYNVIQALSEKEKERLFQMLNIKDVVANKKRKKIITDQQAKEYLIKKLKICQI